MVSRGPPPEQQFYPRDNNSSYHHMERWEHPAESQSLHRHRSEHQHRPRTMDAHRRQASERFYRPHWRDRSRTPSPPREYVYGLERQREWHDLHAEDDEDEEFYHEPEDRRRPQDYDRCPRPEDYRRPEDNYDRRSSSRWEAVPRRPSYEEEERRRRYEEERRWLQEEEDRRQWEAEERYRRYEEEELRRYEEENQRRKEQRRLEEERRRQEEERRLQEEERDLISMEELVFPTSIPKPPPPHPEFQNSHNSNQWELHTSIPSLSSSNNKDEKITPNSVCSHTGSAISKDSSVWIAPYPFFASEHSNKNNKPLHECKTVLGSEESYHYERKMPASLTASLKKEDGSQHSGRVGAFKETSHHNHNNSGRITVTSHNTPLPQKKKTLMTVEIQPGFSLPLRGSQETLDAVAHGRVLETPCMACSCWTVVQDDCDFVICPSCRVVSPVEGGFGTMAYVGLGMSKSAHEATLRRSNYY